MYGGLIFILFVLWIITKLFQAVSSINTSFKNRALLKEERVRKYGNRRVDTSKSLFDRNIDIVEKFSNKIEANPQEGNTDRRRHRPYSSATDYIDNQTRDCINEIVLAENMLSIYPGKEYLTNWQPKAPKNWQDLADQIKDTLLSRKDLLLEQEEVARERKEAEENERAEKERKLILEQQEREEVMRDIEREAKRYAAELSKAKKERKDPILLKKVNRRNENGDLYIEDLSRILKADPHPWSEIEKELISKAYKVSPLPLFSSTSKMEHNLALVRVLNKDINEFNKILQNDADEGNNLRTFFQKLQKGYRDAKKEDVASRFNFVISNMTLPPSVPKIWDIDFDSEEGILIVEIKLPDIVHNQVFKEVSLKSGRVKKPLTIKEHREIVPQIHPAIMLRTAHEVFRNDDADIIKLLVLNGWVEFDDPKTGNTTRTYTASLALTKSQTENLKLSKLDPISAFTGLKGKSAGKLIDIIPVSPMLSLDRKDKRFIETRDVLGKLDAQTNLASMDWQDFENLIAELFQKEFSEEGTEIKLTQSSRDKGVDAIVINPDPIRGGKYVIQAKRYTHTVDVSAVRDLVAVVAHEGASRGILVTTSTFGADAYAFVQNKPITLLDGAKLLGLLEKHNYKFKINLAEARKLNIDSQP